jgi:hypothetical protein
MNDLRVFYCRLCTHVWILPNLPIELGNKVVLIDVVVMIGLMDYNILLRHDYIYVMNILVSSTLSIHDITT